MQGRIEVEDKIERSIEQRLETEPEFVKEWYYSLRAKGTTIKSCRDYLNKVDNFIESLEYDQFELTVDMIKVSDLSKYFMTIQFKTDNDGNKVKTSDSYRNAVWFALNNFFEYHYEVGNISKNHMKIVKPLKSADNDSQKRILLAPNDFKKMLCHIPGDNLVMIKRNKAILLLYMTTGMRRDALCQANLSDIDFDTSEIVITDKGEKTHIYNLNEETMNAILDWMECRKMMNHHPTDALFITYQGNRMTGNSVYNMISKCSSEALGRSISPHKLRAGLCSILYEETHDIEFVRRAIGHSNISTTQRYIVTEGNEKKTASQIMAKLI